MKREEKCILTNMCMIYDNNRILVQDRKKSTWPGVAFPGGHIEDKESFVDSVIREVKEETGLDIFDVRLCGVKQFTPKDSLCRYIVFFFKTNKILIDDEECTLCFDRTEYPNNYISEDQNIIRVVMGCHIINRKLLEDYKHDFDKIWEMAISYSDIEKSE